MTRGRDPPLAASALHLWRGISRSGGLPGIKQDVGNRHLKHLKVSVTVYVRTAGEKVAGLPHHEVAGEHPEAPANKLHQRQAAIAINSALNCWT